MISKTLNLKPTERIFSKAAKKEINVFDLRKVVKETIAIAKDVKNKVSFNLESMIDKQKFEMESTNEDNQKYINNVALNSFINKISKKKKRKLEFSLNSDAKVYPDLSNL